MQFRNAGSTDLDRYSQSICPSSFRFFQNASPMGLPISEYKGQFVLSTLNRAAPFFGSSWRIRLTSCWFSMHSFHFVRHAGHLLYLPTIPESSYSAVEPHIGHLGSSDCMDMSRHLLGCFVLLILIMNSADTI